MSRTAEGRYRCNWCKADLTAQENGPTHISIVIGPQSGIAECDTHLSGWRVYRQIRPGRYHFCNSTELKFWWDRIILLPMSEQPAP